MSDCRQYKEERRPFPGATVASIGDVDPSLITRWCASEPKLLQRLQAARAKAVLGKGRFPRVETQLFRDFQACRKKGLRIGRRWLRTKARIIAKKLYPGRYFRASEGWCTNWLRRNNLSYRKKTNKKTKSTEERLPKIKRWQARLRHPPLADTRDPEWGVWLPKDRYNVDQVYIPFLMQCSSTYEEKGSARVWLSGTKNADDKRFCTLQCLVRMCGLDDDGKHQQPRQTICFRGTGVRISAEERAGYDKRARVVFQPKAYYDDEMCAEWAVSDFNSQVDHVQRKVVFCDNLSGQTTPAWVAGLKESNTDSHLLPTDVTDELQVVDQGVGNEVKKECGVVQDEWLQVPGNLEKWTTGFTASERRVLITEWVGEACDRVFTRLDLVKLFERTGMGLRLDGANDCKITLAGVREYTFTSEDANIEVPPTKRRRGVGGEILPVEHVNHVEEHDVVAVGGLFMPSTLSSAALITEEEAAEVAVAVAEDVAKADDENENEEMAEEESSD
ncbi:hypothetical protein CYMTET_35951 [Cymbomonas tetramitiformis]|uniref:HTH CENPB-type domain-containing protein n=1 Tax=Cymbomonas tetramitiformis TaxID=36881 RepID=A0AAE0F886_9CHLO|nr:hypothetical protein CYMTET_35951 [Cymbomonas tetramitiformis]